MDITQEGLNLIKSFESCRLKAYRDIVGVWTIGWGETNGVTPSMEITQEQADQMLLDRLAQFKIDMLPLLPGSMNDNQFSACLSLAYNIGMGNFKKSLLLRCLQKYNFEDAAKQFSKWNHAGGRVVPGLTRRREAERLLFIKPL
jgi:lysozyme